MKPALQQVSGFDAGPNTTKRRKAAGGELKFSRRRELSARRSRMVKAFGWVLVNNLHTDHIMSTPDHRWPAALSFVVVSQGMSPSARCRRLAVPGHILFWQQDPNAEAIRKGLPSSVVDERLRVAR